MANSFSQLVRSFFSRPAVIEPDTGGGPAQSGFNPLASYYRSRMELSSQRIKKYKDYCLAGGTKVLLQDGSKVSIQELFEKGLKDFWVFSYDIHNKNYVPGLVHEAVLRDHQYDEMIEVTLENGASIKATLNHPFLLNSGSYVRADELSVDSIFMPIGGSISPSVVSIRRVQLEPVYDLAMSNYHNFAVEGGIFVHNSDMGQDTFISGALNVYADEATQMDRTLGSSVWAVTSNKKVDTEIRELFDRIDIEDHLFGIARYTAQYGDCFVRPLASKDEGIVSLEFMEAEDVERLVDVHARLTGFRVPFMGDREFNPWDMVHFRIISLAHTIRTGGGLYGTSMLENTRRTWRTLTLLEDTLVIYRLEIGGRHRIFYIDVGGMSHEQALSTVRKYQRQFSKKEYYNAESGEWTSRFNPLNLTADIFWPIRKESQSRVDYLGTDPNINGIVDIEYFRNKLFASLRVPRAYLGGDEYSSVKFGLSQLDISFSRLIKRLQRAVLNGLTDLTRIHLMLKNIDPRDARNDFTLMMTPPSTLDQEQKLETLNLSLDIAMKLKQVGDMLNIDEQAMAAYIQRAIIGLTPYDLRHGGRVGTDSDGSVGFDDKPKDTRKALLDSMVSSLTEKSNRVHTGLDDLPEVGSAMDSIADELQKYRPIEEDDASSPFSGELTIDQLEALRGSLRNRN